LRQAKGLELLPVCDAIAGLLERAADASPDIVLLDYTPEVTFGLLEALKKWKVVLWVRSIPMEFAYQALGLGVRGILRKSLPVDIHMKCLRDVRAGQFWFEKPLTDTFLRARRVVLTPREGQLIHLLSKGMKNKEIAAALLITEGTVKVYLSRLFRKLQVKDRFELTLFALKNLNPGQPPETADGRSRLATGLRSFVVPGPVARTETAPFSFMQ
jgi:two-component system, NarL family, nitrate/nitrite response regulator NarL